jgi:hypothetical protein
MGGHQRIESYSVHVKCLPGARMSLMISDDGTLPPRICAALVGELHAARSRGTPTLPALELRRPERERKSQRRNNLVTPETRPETLRGTGSRTRRTATRATGRATRSRTGTRVGRGEIRSSLFCLQSW